MSHQPSSPSLDAKARAAATYNASADFFDAPQLAFWERIGLGTVQRLRLQPGTQVLDACCGSGASAIPAAQAAGSSGRVVGVDLADNLLQLGRVKAGVQNLNHIEFRCQDIETLDGSEKFDAVICVFGIFFLPDMVAGVRKLWDLTRPGGRLAITTWGPRMFEPGNTAFWNAVREERPDLYKTFSPWDRINEPATLAALLAEGGVPQSDIVAECSVQALREPADFWAIALGSGYRGTIEQLDSETRVRVRQRTLEYLLQNAVDRVETNALYAIARKPPES